MADQTQRKQHWVEDVFPPTFSYTSRELLETEIADEADINGGGGKKKSPSVYEMVARRISPLDATDIRNVYERVWLMTIIEEEERKKRAKEAKESREVTESSRAQKPLVRSDIVKALGDIKLDETQESKQVDIDDTRLWDSDEIEILREVFKSAKTKNGHLKAILKANQDHFRKLQRKCKKQSAVIELRTHKLQEAQKANERLQIAGDNLVKQLTSANKTIEFLHEEIKDLRETQSELSKEVHNLRLELDKERIDRKNTQFDLINQQQTALREMELREEKLKLLHAEDIEYLQNQVESLTKEIEKEKSDHQRSLKGLQHLRNHFSSVSLVGDVAEHDRKANVVNTDQLKKWTL